jgi:hypothetical protein
MRPHRTDGVSLSFGLLFLAVALWWAVAQVIDIQLPALGWLAAAALILFGAVGLLSAIRSGRRTEVEAPVRVEAAAETDTDLPPELHADIIRELLENPADRPLPADPVSPGQATTTTLPARPVTAPHPEPVDVPTSAPPAAAPPGSVPRGSVPPGSVPPGSAVPETHHG